MVETVNLSMYHFNVKDGQRVPPARITDITRGELGPPVDQWNPGKGGLYLEKNTLYINDS